MVEPLQANPAALADLVAANRILAHEGVLDAFDPATGTAGAPTVAWAG